ncbi:MAG: hypothetical protein WAW85_01550 [Gordonia sp. (in: high G+C Gram-positive bacteria)]|uniref:hypothetical protein n=1 Tax=Gordonia sp. (in: high G+C Gram-positive bacteria) TaxID=84139 RepID=UPI003BB609BF
MTTLNDVFGADVCRRSRAQASVDVFGVAWPVYKVHALLAGLAAVVLVLALGGTGAVAVWVGAATVLLVWWGERAALHPRWDDRACDHHARR